MLQPEKPSTLSTKLNNARSSCSVLIPDGAIPLPTLRKLESELLSRQIVKDGNFYPLWFHAQTERNIFLWRLGCSVLQEDEFEFWVNVPALISKRIESLDRNNEDNPLMNPSWGSSRQSLDQEHGYLSEVRSTFAKIGLHANALALAGRAVELEIRGDNGVEVVVLPVITSGPLSLRTLRAKSSQRHGAPTHWAPS